MQRLITLLFCTFVIVPGWSDISLAQTDAGLAEGRAKAAAGDVKGALATYRAQTEINPDSADAFTHLGGMQLLDRRYSDAVKSFQRAIALGDKGRSTFIGMGLAYVHMGRLGPARAALVEARSRGSGDSTDIDRIIDWIDSRIQSMH